MAEAYPGGAHAALASRRSSFRNSLRRLRPTEKPDTSFMRGVWKYEIFPSYVRVTNKQVLQLDAQCQELPPCPSVGQILSFKLPSFSFNTTTYGSRYFTVAFLFFGAEDNEVFLKPFFVMHSDQDIVLSVLNPRSLFIEKGKFTWYIVPIRLVKNPYLYLQILQEPLPLPAASYARYVLQKLVLLEMKGGCREPELDTETLTTMFEVSVAFFKVGHAVGETGNGCVDLRWLAKSFFELTVLKDIIGICYGATVKGMQSYGLERLAAMLMATVKMEELGHLTTEKQEYALRLATVGYPKAGVYSGLIGGATSVLLSAYNRHPLFQPLHTVMRETLFIGSHVVLRELRLNVTTQGPNLALYQLLSTALCSALEIGEVLRGLALGTESGLFSPCYLSLRFDLTRDKLLSMAPQEAMLDQAAVSNAVDGFLGRLSLEREDRDAWHLPAYKCVDRLDKVLMIIPLINVTFIISSDREVRGSALYEASTTYLSSSLFLSPVIMNKCSQGAVAGEPRQIPKIQNFTRTQKSCIFCGFALLSYDEKEGLETTTYITSQEVQNSILSSNYFDFDNLHVHYLLLTTNGTVMEIAGLYEERAHVVLAIILYFIAFALGIFLVHKIVMFFL